MNTHILELGIVLIFLILPITGAKASVLGQLREIDARLEERKIEVQWREPVRKNVLRA
jgi:hypothetical protein